MDLGLAGRRALITGASKGIGRSTALSFAAEGVADIHVTARNGDELEALRKEIESSSNAKVHPYALDLTDAAAREAMIDQVGDIDILINNAGAVPPGSLDVVDEAAWRAGWELKVFGFIAMTRAYYKRMRDQGHGVIVNDIGNSGEAFDYHYIAGSSGNASLMAFTRALGGRSMDDGIRVVGVNAGPVATDRMQRMLRQRARDRYDDENRWQSLTADMPGGRAATPEEVADLMVYLASDRAAYISGTIVTIDGGIASRKAVS